MSRPKTPVQVFIPAQVIKDFAPIRKKVEKAMDQAPKTVTFQDAWEQVKAFQKTNKAQ